MNIKKQIKKFVPAFILAKRRMNILKKSLKPLIGTEEYWKHIEEINYMLSIGRPLAIPYKDVHEKYSNYIGRDIVQHEDGFPYVLHKISDGSTAKLFFPRDMDADDVSILYYSLITEQDELSPHCYFDKEHKLSKDDILLDIGAAEGIVSLTYINEIKKAILFEGDEKWREPLRKTFALFGNKIEIVTKYVSDTSSDTTVTLNEYITSDEQYFLKMDIEGMEIQVLRSIENVLDHIDAKGSICIYHRLDDSKIIEEFFNTINYSARMSPRLMFIGMNARLNSFRKGVLYVRSL